MGKYEERMELFRKVVKCEPIERIPVAPSGNAYMARANGIMMGKYITDFDAAIEANVKEHKRIDADFTQSTLFHPYLLGPKCLCKVAIPYDGVGEDEMWQVIEKEGNVTTQDYETIREIGWEKWLLYFVRVRGNNNFKKLETFFSAVPKAYKAFKDAGIPCINDLLMVSPFEYFSGGRGLVTFLCDDVLNEPERTHEIIDIVLEAELEKYDKMMKDIHAVGAWIGGLRSSPDFVSPAMFDEFVLPSLIAYYELCIKNKVVPIFHLDSNWTLFLERFRDNFTEKEYIMALDSKTDIRKAREVLGTKVCIMGDVPCELMAFGSPEQVREYVTKLIDDIGPWGIIISTGCDIPSNAKTENVFAMSEATHTYPL